MANDNCITGRMVDQRVVHKILVRKGDYGWRMMLMAVEMVNDV